MCERHIYYGVGSDGREKKMYQVKYCPKAYHNHHCDQTKDFKHPRGEPIPSQATSHYYNMPPSPPSSDSSFPHSGSEGHHKRRSGVYINGEKILDINRKPSRRERRKSDHVVIVDSPLSPQPSQRSDMASISPSYDVYEALPRHYHTPPEVRIEVNDHHRTPRSHVRRYSTTTRHQSHSHGSSSVSDEERVRKVVQEEMRRQKLQSEIDKQNEKIASRPAVPPAPQVIPRYRRPSVSVRQPVDELADAIQHLRVSQKEVEAVEAAERRRAKRLQEQRERDEEEAQRRRLMARMTPQRSNTLRHEARGQSKIMYDDGLYRSQW